MTIGYERDLARACKRWLTPAEMDFVIDVAFNHADRLIPMFNATLAGTSIGGRTADEAEERLARQWLQLCRDTMAGAPGGSA